MDVTLNSVDRASVTQRRDARQFDLYAEVLSAFADDPIVVYGAWFIPGATSNWAKYDIPEVTALYQEQLRILDQAQRLQKVKEMQRKSLDAAWWDPASESTVVHAFYAQVKDFPTASFGFFSNRWRFERVWLDR
jgi:ABC-type transport system substrate-binding protein